MPKKVLFVIHDLGHGGAEKVLVNLVNHMDPAQFEVTVMALFGGGVNAAFLAPHIRRIDCFSRNIPANSKWMKLFSPRALHRHFIKEHYDIEVAYLEGMAARIVSGCECPDTKTVCWVHGADDTIRKAECAFRSHKEAERAYRTFDRIVCVAETVKADFTSLYNIDAPVVVRYNTNETSAILAASAEPCADGLFAENEYKLVGVGKLIPKKGFDRLVRIHARLRANGLPVHTYLLGIGPMQTELESMLRKEECADSFTFLGYQTNPYKYVANCDLFVCASHAEGFSTAATEALIVGTPVCTVEVSGMREMLGAKNEYGIVTENDEEALYCAIKELLEQPEHLTHYRARAALRGRDFSTEQTVAAVEELLINL